MQRSRAPPREAGTTDRPSQVRCASQQRERCGSAGPTGKGQRSGALGQGDAVYWRVQLHCTSFPHGPWHLHARCPRCGTGGTGSTAGSKPVSSYGAWAW